MLYSGADSRRCSQTRLETRNRKWSQSTYHVSENIVFFLSPTKTPSFLLRHPLWHNEKKKTLQALRFARQLSRLREQTRHVWPPRRELWEEPTWQHSWSPPSFRPGWPNWRTPWDMFTGPWESASSHPIQRRVWIKENIMQNCQTNKPATVVVLLEWKWKDAKNSTEPYFAQLVMSVLNLFFGFPIKIIDLKKVCRLSEVVS